MSPTISVIVPTRDRANSLERCLDSVLGQTYSPHEVVVIDDGSRDGTQSLLERYSSLDGRLRVVETKGVGANAARNIGVEAAVGDFVAFQDSDDVWHRNKLELQVGGIRDSATLVYCSLAKVYRNGVVDYVHPPAGHQDDFQALLLASNWISTQTVLGPRQVLLDHPFDTSLRRFQDWELWIRLSRTNAFVHVNEVAVTAFETDGSITSNSSLVAPSIFRILDRHSDLYRSERSSRRRLLRMALGSARRSGDWRGVVGSLRRWR